MKPNSFICVVALLSLAGCDELRPMTNSDIIAATKYCETNGLRAVPFHSGMTFRTLAIECRPQK